MPQRRRPARREHPGRHYERLSCTIAPETMEALQAALVDGRSTSSIVDEALRALLMTNAPKRAAKAKR